MLDLEDHITKLGPIAQIPTTIEEIEDLFPGSLVYEGKEDDKTISPFFKVRNKGFLSLKKTYDAVTKFIRKSEIWDYNDQFSLPPNWSNVITAE
jgi:hypothetical protein